MSRVNGKNIVPGSIESVSLSIQAKEDIRSGKLVAARVSVSAFSFPAAATANVSTVVLAAATTDTPVTDLATKGIYVGAVANAGSPRAVALRHAGTSNAINDGTGDDVYGVLTETFGFFNLATYQHDGTPFTFSAPTSVDFLFIEIFDLDSMPADVLLNGATAGAIDAETFDQAVTAYNTAVAAQASIDTHENGGASKHDATEIDYEAVDAAKVSVRSTSDDLETAVTDLDLGKFAFLTAIVAAESHTSLVSAPSVILGVTLVNNDAVLLTAQNALSENGLYIYSAGSLTRSSKMNKLSQFMPGLIISIVKGSKAGTHWMLTGTVSVLETSDVVFAASRGEDETLLKLEQNLDFPKRVKISPSFKVLSTGETLILDMNQFPLLFHGAQIDYETGNILNYEGTLVVDTFTPPVITDDEYLWSSVTVIPFSVDAQNRIVGTIVPAFSLTSDPVRDDAPRTGFLTGKSIGQVVLLGDTGDPAGFEDITRSNFEIIALSGSEGSTNVEREVPSGAVDGVNTTFTLTKTPTSKATTFVFLDSFFVPYDQWALVTDTQIQFTTPPADAQTVEVFYFPDPLTGITAPITGGGGTSLANIDIDPYPDGNGSHHLGTDTRGWASVKLKDTMTADVYRLEIENGVIQVILVE